MNHEGQTQTMSDVEFRPTVGGQVFTAGARRGELGSRVMVTDVRLRTGNPLTLLAISAEQHSFLPTSSQSNANLNHERDTRHFAPSELGRWCSLLSQL